MLGIELKVGYNNWEIDLFPPALIITALLAIMKIVGWIEIGWLAVFSPVLVVLAITLSFFAFVVLFVNRKK